MAHCKASGAAVGCCLLVWRSSYRGAQDKSHNLCLLHTQPLLSGTGGTTVVAATGRRSRRCAQRRAAACARKLNLTKGGSHQRAHGVQRGSKPEGEIALESRGQEPGEGTSESFEGENAETSEWSSTMSRRAELTRWQKDALCIACAAGPAPPTGLHPHAKGEIGSDDRALEECS